MYFQVHEHVPGLLRQMDLQRRNNTRLHIIRLGRLRVVDLHLELPPRHVVNRRVVEIPIYTKYQSCTFRIPHKTNQILTDFDDFGVVE